MFDTPEEKAKRAARTAERMAAFVADMREVMRKHGASMDLVVESHEWDSTGAHIEIDFKEKPGEEFVWLDSAILNETDINP